MRGCVWECEILSCFSKRSDYCFFSDKWSRICGNFLSRQSSKICIIQICRECIFLFSFIGSEIPKALSTLVQASETFQSCYVYRPPQPTYARVLTHTPARTRAHTQHKNIEQKYFLFREMLFHLSQPCRKLTLLEVSQFFIILFLLSFFLAAV